MVSTSPIPPKTPPLLPLGDSEQSFFRTWALRSSEPHYSNNSSSASIPISPKTVVLGRAKRASHQAEYSESSIILEDPREDTAMHSAPGITTQSLISGGNPQFRVTKPSEAGISDPKNGGRSLSLSHAQRLLRSYSRDSANSVSEPAELPSQKSKNGFAWKREISGHWFEIRMGRKRRRSDELLSTDTEDTNITPPDATLASNTPQTDSAPHYHSCLALEDSGQKEGFYGRMKRRFGLFQDSSVPNSDEHIAKSFTWDMLKRASSVLHEFSEKARSPPLSSSASGSTRRISPGSNQSIAGSHNRLSHLLPCGRGPFSSSSSSLRNMKMAPPPQSTPESVAMYTAADSQQYFRVELTDPDGPAFLPSEARRIGTPPLQDSALCDFYFNLGTPVSPNVETVPDPCPERRLDRKKPCMRDWYKLKMEAMEAEDMRSQTFELDVPEHLPNSPLCPRNHKHPSRGKGVCVYHGRNKSIDWT